jgi:hypothetical protein
MLQPPTRRVEIISTLRFRGRQQSVKVTFFILEGFCPRVDGLFFVSARQALSDF